MTTTRVVCWARTAKMGTMMIGGILMLNFTTVATETAAEEVPQTTRRSAGGEAPPVAEGDERSIVSPPQALLPCHQIILT